MLTKCITKTEGGEIKPEKVLTYTVEVYKGLGLN